MDVEQSSWPAVSAAVAAGREAFTALIIDDEPHVRAFLRLALRSLGLRDIREAANGAEGFALFKQVQPTVVLLDINMPVLAGEATLRQILARDPDAAVIVVTSDSQHDTVKRYLGLGAIGYVLKHRPAAEVHRMLDQALACFVVDGEA